MKQFFKNNVSVQSASTEAERIRKHDLANETQKAVYRAFFSERNIAIPDYLKSDKHALQTKNVK